MTTTNDITKPLTQLHEDRDKYVRRSAEVLLDIDIGNMDFFYVDPILKTWLMDSAVENLKGNSDVLAPRRASATWVSRECWPIGSSTRWARPLTTISTILTTTGTQTTTGMTTERRRQHGHSCDRNPQPWPCALFRLNA